MKQKIEVIIFAAGKGTRLGQLGENIPKVLLPVWKSQTELEPLILRILRQIKRLESNGQFEIVNTYLVVNFLKEHIEALLKKINLVDVRFVFQEYLNGEAGGLFLIEPTPNPILAIDGDNYLADDDFFVQLAHQYTLKRCYAAIGVKEVPDIGRYANVKVGGNGQLVNIIEKPSPNLAFGSLSKMGCYMLSPELVSRGEAYFADSRGEISTTAAFSNACREGQLIQCVEYPISRYYLDIGEYMPYIKHISHSDR